MKKFFSFLLLAIIFTGCELKPALKQDPLYEKTLKYTQRCQIINSLETKAMLDVVYLNPIYPQLKKPSFLVGVYNDLNNTLNNAEFNFTINQKPVKISSTIPSYILYKNFPFYNSWMNYYLVETNTSAPFVIEYKSKHWGECKLKF
jgi:hypothetical protein